jgi:GR25 family glycosyltransferase involved in LPS biosynthesis
MKVFVINLERRKDRLEQLNIPFEYEVFKATDGIYVHGNDTDKRYRAHLGCKDSHIRLLKKIVEDDLPMAMICEDDVHFVKNNFSMPMSFDLLLLGGKNVGNIIDINDKWRLVERFHGTHCYIITKDFAKRLIVHLESTKQHKIDLAISQFLTQGKCFILKQPIAIQNDGYSDIQFKTISH